MKSITKKSFLSIKLFLLILFTNNLSHANPTNQQYTHIITIFIHGLVGVPSKQGYLHLVNIINNTIEGTSYEKHVASERAKTSFYEPQAKQGLGLIPINIDQKPGNGAGATADIFEQINNLAYQEKTDTKNLFFTFGWTGLATQKGQKEAGIKLYYAIENLADSLKKQGFKPFFRVIGYSHGGNVALNLGSACSLHYQEHSFVVDELILLATPIICETDFLAQSTLFKNIYNIYSLNDTMQSRDFLSLKRWRSRQLFQSRKNFQLPKNLYQIQVKITDFTKHFKLSKNALTSAPYIMGTAPYLQDNSPGHFHFWQVEPIWNKKTHYPSPFHPLPVVVFVPYIIQAAKKYPKATPHQSIIVDFRPYFKQIIVRTTQKNQSKHSIIPMIGTKEIKQLARNALCYKPDTATSTP